MRLIDADKMKEYMKVFTNKELMENEEVFEIIDEQPTVKINGNTSDGYHTFNELYHHRAILFAVICNENKDKAWKSKRHSDGTMYDGMFIVGIKTPHGDYTYHYNIEPYWNLFDVKTLAFAPEWDGHKPEDVDRLLSLPTDRGGEGQGESRRGKGEGKRDTGRGGSGEEGSRLRGRTEAEDRRSKNQSESRCGKGEGGRG